MSEDRNMDFKKENENQNEKHVTIRGGTRIRGDTTNVFEVVRQ